VLFSVSYDNDWRFWELPAFVLIGVLMGIYGALFSKLNIRWAKLVRGGTWIKSYPVTEVALVTLFSYVPISPRITCARAGADSHSSPACSALLSFLNPYTRMSGTELVLSLLCASFSHRWWPFAINTN
jgi:chloride channel 3/4/5